LHTQSIAQICFAKAGVSTRKMTVAAICAQLRFFEGVALNDLTRRIRRGQDWADSHQLTAAEDLACGYSCSQRPLRQRVSRHIRASDSGLGGRVICAPFFGECDTGGRPKAPEQAVFFAQDRNPAVGLELRAGAASNDSRRSTGAPVLSLRAAVFGLAVGDPVYFGVLFELSERTPSRPGQLGKCPPHLGSDNSSAATHESEQVPGRPRGFNADYLELCTHYDLTPVTINVGCPHEQGDVESQRRSSGARPR
jgi:hypothetical protein